MTSKENTKSIIGPLGVREILGALNNHCEQRHVSVGTVAIGGINSSNVQKVLRESASEKLKLDGVAVVSAIVGAESPQNAARDLKQLIMSAYEPDAFPFSTRKEDKTNTSEELLTMVPGVIKDLVGKTPLCHNMTNLVVQNFAANVALCM